MNDALAALQIVVLIALAAGLLILISQFRLVRRRQKQLWRRVERLETGALEARKAIATAAAERSLASTPGPGTPRFRFTAQENEDVFLYELFEGKRSGRYIEVGAHDGQHLSVTLPFEALGWSGVLIEPVRKNFEACKAARPGSHVVHAALGPAGSTGTVTFNEVVGDEHSGVMSYLETNQQHADDLAAKAAKVNAVEVPYTTMTQVLAEAPDPEQHYDFAVIDVEGGEVGLFQGFDLARFSPTVLVVEDKADPDTSPVRPIIEAAGYERATAIGINDVYVHRSRPELIRRARRLGFGTR
ncbi:MAG: FkbM family methyltransferase [Phycisphaerales bacterium JB065]